MEFLAIDVETANADMASICQIGIAHYLKGSVINEWTSYVDPEDYFDDINISIHGIDDRTVTGAPIFPEISDDLYRLLDNKVAVCHTHFDRVAIKQAAGRSAVRIPSCTWLDSARVTRRAWPAFASKGYGLKNVCKVLGYDFRHHDALEDAKAAGHILIAASQKHGFTIEDWLKRVGQPIDPSQTGATLSRDGNPEGDLYGEVLVFTGTLEIPRREAADMAAGIGCKVGSSVTKKTTLLVVGDQDVTKLAGHDKSTKHRKAEELILNGASIRILRETDFKELVASS